MNSKEKRKFKEEFCVFILSHGRPDKIVTLKSLERAGYTGKVFIVIDNEDSAADRYYELYGEKVLMFDKLKKSKEFDTADNFDNRKTIVYARNACFDLAEKVGCRYFIELDDDYSIFAYKFTETMDYHESGIRNLDLVWFYMLEFYKSIPAHTIAMAQGGDFIGGANGGIAKTWHVKRKAMNTFFCDTERRFDFLGRINEDVNTYTTEGNRGKIFLTVPLLSITQSTTQSNSGGMTDVYLETGTYLKSFYTVMYCPSFVKIYEMGPTNKRLHHRISWNNAVPKILRPELQKCNKI